MEYDLEVFGSHEKYLISKYKKYRKARSRAQRLHWLRMHLYRYLQWKHPIA